MDHGSRQPEQTQAHRVAPLNNASQSGLPVALAASAGGALSGSDQLIATAIGRAGALIAAGIGYLIESTATGTTAGLGGALVCALVFFAAYKSLQEHGF